MQTNRIHALSLGVSLALAASIVQAASFSQLVIFGDSLSDSGNNAQILGTNDSQVILNNGYVGQTPWGGGTYSNGPVWSTKFAAELGLPLAPSLPPAGGGTNYAYGGAQSGAPGPGAGGFPYSLTAQLSQYLGATGNVADPNALYVVAGGANDARVFFSLPPGTISAQQMATTYAANTVSIVDALQTAGAQHIVVWNVPNLGLTPAVAFSGPAAIAGATAVSQLMNFQLEQGLAGEGPGVMIFDTYKRVTDVVTNGSLGGITFSNVTDACGAPTAGCDASTSLFWDGRHPTTLGHQMLADELFDQITAAVPEPASLMLILAGLGGLAVCVRRRGLAS